MKPDTDQPPMSKSVVKRLQAQGADQPVVAEDDFEYVTRVDVNMAIIREIAKLQFKERLPRIMAGVAKQLMDAGVDFSRAVLPENFTITDEEWDAIYEDLS